MPVRSYLEGLKIVKIVKEKISVSYLEKVKCSRDDSIFNTSPVLDCSSSSLSIPLSVVIKFIIFYPAVVYKSA